MKHRSFWFVVIASLAFASAGCEEDELGTPDAAMPEPDAAVPEPVMDAAIDAAAPLPPTSCGDLVLEPVDCDDEIIEYTDDVNAPTTLEAGCYRITRNISVTSALSIEPGTNLYFAQNTALSVSGDGSVRAEGLPDAPVAFLGEQETRGFWRGIEFRGTDSLDNVLDYVLVAHAGGGSTFAATSTTHANIVLTSPSSSNPSVAITHTISRDSGGYGLYLPANAAVRDFENNVLTGNELGPAFVHATTMRNLDASTCYTENDVDVVAVQGQTVASNGTWPAIDVPYQMRGNTSLNAHITIEPGAVLSFAAGAALSIQDSSGDAGALTAEGTEEEPIVFTGAQQTRGYWRGIEVRGVNRVENSLDHVVIEYAGGGSTFAATGTTHAALVLTSPSSASPSMAIKHTTIRESAGYGLFLPALAVERDFEGNTLTANTSGAAYVHATTARNLDHTSSYAGNDEDRVVVVNQTVDSSGTWPALDVPYEFRGNTTLEAHITVQAGATVGFAMDGSLTVAAEGALTAQGTEEAPIVFTGAQQTAGFWRGIVFRASDDTNNIFDHVIVEYAGGGSVFAATGSTHASVALTTPSSATSRLAMTNTTIRHGAGWGMFISDLAVLTPADWNSDAGNDLSDNASGAYTN